VLEVISSQGALSLRQIAEALNRRGIATPRGGPWSAVQVWRILRQRLNTDMEQNGATARSAPFALVSI
jgi:hypothetical protein